MPKHTIEIGMMMNSVVDVFKQSGVAIEEIQLAEESRQGKKVNTYRALPLFKSSDALFVVASSPASGEEFVVEKMYWHLNWRSDYNLPKTLRGNKYLHLQRFDIRILEVPQHKPLPEERSGDDPF